MRIEDIKELVREKRRERASDPWLTRIVLNIYDSIRVGSFMDEIKWFFQKHLQGFSDDDTMNLNSFIINNIRAPFKEYKRHQEEEGRSLPSEFSLNPSGWLEVLAKIDFAIDHEWREMNDLDYYPYNGLTIEGILEHELKVKEGFALLGKYLMDLWD